MTRKRHTRFPSVRLQPLGHLSVASFIVQVFKESQLDYK